MNFAVFQITVSFSLVYFSWELGLCCQPYGMNRLPPTDSLRNYQPRCPKSNIPIPISAPTLCVLAKKPRWLQLVSSRSSTNSNSPTSSRRAESLLSTTLSTTRRRTSGLRTTITAMASPSLTSMAMVSTTFISSTKLEATSYGRIWAVASSRTLRRRPESPYPDRISVAAAFADIDNDGDQDLFVTTVRGGNALFENDGHGHFKDITKEAGLDLVAHSSGAVFFDYDNDGLLDLLVCNVGRYTSDQKGPNGEYVGLQDAFMGHLHPERFEYPVLYKNMGHNHFKDVTAEVGLHPVGWCGDATFADLNGDGWPDLFLLNMAGSSHYYENSGGKKFVDKTAQYFPKTPFGSMGIIFFDYDNDGRLDLFITDMHSDMFQEVGPEAEKLKAASHPPDSRLGGPASKFIFGNALYHNLGDGKFEEVSDRMGVENYWPWGPSVGDLNADGWQDIFIPSGMGFPFRYGINSLLLNNRGEKFLDAEFLLGVEPRRDGRTHTPWFELDCSQKVPESLVFHMGRDGSLQRAFGENRRVRLALEPLGCDL